MELEQLAKEAYETYAKSLDVTESWSVLHPEVRDAWIASTEKIRELIKVNIGILLNK